MPPIYCLEMGALFGPLNLLFRDRGIVWVVYLLLHEPRANLVWTDAGSPEHRANINKKCEG